MKFGIMTHFDPLKPSDRQKFDAFKNQDDGQHMSTVGILKATHAARDKTGIRYDGGIFNRSKKFDIRPYRRSRRTRTRYIYSTLFAIYMAAIENKHNKTKAANSTRPHDKCIKCY